MERHDALGRRHRDRPTSTGKRVTPQPRDLLWFQKLHEHGPLSSSHLHAFSKHLASSEKRSRDRLTDLFNEGNTPHGGAYLTRPVQQFATLDARYQELVHDIGKPAERALREADLWNEYGTSPGGPWKHRAMVAAITASIELEAIADPNLSYIPQHAILARAGTTLRYPVSFKDPRTGREERHVLIPDAIFGLEYRHSGTPLYRFFLVEADRATEPASASSFSRKSYLRNFLQYREYIGRGLYKEHLKLTAPLLVLNVSTSEVVIKRMVGVVAALRANGCGYQLFGVHQQPSSSRGSTLLTHAEWVRHGEPMMDLLVP